MNLEGKIEVKDIAEILFEATSTHQVVNGQCFLLTTTLQSFKRNNVSIITAIDLIMSRLLHEVYFLHGKGKTNA